MTVGKRKSRSKSSKRHFDTSVCQVKFRKVRVNTRRKRYFDEDRDLIFVFNRNIRARLQGVRFRKEDYAIGFRNAGIGNIEDAAEISDWPDVGPATKPDSMVLERDADYNLTWGKDQSYQEKWGTPMDDDWDSALDPAERIPPQLSYYHLKEETKEEPHDDRMDRYESMLNKQKRAMARKSRAAARKTEQGRPKLKKDQPAWPSSSSPQPVYEVVETEQEPIIALPSKEEKKKYEFQVEKQPSHKEVSRPEPVYLSVSPKDKKRAFAFNEYALNLMESGKYAKAMTYFEKALSLDPIEETYKINKKRCQQWLDYKQKRGR